MLVLYCNVMKSSTFHFYLVFTEEIHKK